MSVGSWLAHVMGVGCLELLLALERRRTDEMQWWPVYCRWIMMALWGVADGFGQGRLMVANDGRRRRSGEMGFRLATAGSVGAGHGRSLAAGSLDRAEGATMDADHGRDGLPGRKRW
ncbi:hypothetical protein ACLOJK_029384 [Asimina triloba]